MLKRILLTFLVVALGFFLRQRAVALLPPDFDEDDYLRAGQLYAEGFRQGDWAVVWRENYRTEHPPLTKLATGVALTFLPPAPEIPDRPVTAPPDRDLPQPHLRVARWLQAGYGVATALVLALVNPVAGLALAVQTWHIKYTSQVMLEALPALTSLLALLFYRRASKHPADKRPLLLSALMLGLTVASKYPYALVGVAIGVDWLGRVWPVEQRSRREWLRRLLPLAGWGLLALAVFILADPYLWPDPLTRLRESLFYHGGYAQSEQVRQANYPLWQPLVWLFGSAPWHPGVFLLQLDLFIAVMALLGLGRLWREQRLFALWLGISLAFLLVWPTKWPQYSLMLVPQVSLAAALGFESYIRQPLRAALRRDRRRQVSSPTAASRVNWQDVRAALPWLLPGLIGLGLILFYPLLYQFAMALTDFNLYSLRDGINGGVWRAAWAGLTGQERPVDLALVGQQPLASRNVVHYIGPALFAQLLAGVVSSVMVFNIIWTVLGVTLQAGLGVAVALALAQPGVRFRRAWLALFILPWALPEFVGALVWLNMLHPRSGWLTLLLDRPLPWDQNPSIALLVFLLAATWMGWPIMMLAATAGLKLIPPDVYEAAALDGAGRWARFRGIIWPMLLPLLAPAIILRAIATFNQFYLFYTLPASYPQVTFAALSFFLFDTTNRGGGQFAVSAALNIFTVLALTGLILVFDRWSKATEGVDYA